MKQLQDASCVIIPEASDCCISVNRTVRTENFLQNNCKQQESKYYMIHNRILLNWRAGELTLGSFFAHQIGPALITLQQHHDKRYRPKHVEKVTDRDVRPR
jgi:hypothetical protein